MIRLICFLLIFVMLSSSLAEEFKYAEDKLRTAKNKLEEFIKDHPKSYFETDARLKLAEVSFYLSKPALLKNYSNDMKYDSLAYSLKQYEMVERIENGNKLEEASLYGQCYIYYLLVLNEVKTQSNFLMLFSKYKDLLLINEYSAYLNDVRLMLAHSYFFTRNENMALDLIDSVDVNKQNFNLINYIKMWANFRLEKDNEALEYSVVLMDSLFGSIEQDTSARPLFKEAEYIFSLVLTVNKKWDDFVEAYKVKPYFLKLAYSVGQAYLEYARYFDQGYRLLRYLSENFTEEEEGRKSALILEQFQKFVDESTGELNLSSIDPVNFSLDNIEIAGIAPIPKIEIYSQKELFHSTIADPKVNFKERILNRQKDYIR